MTTSMIAATLADFERKRHPLKCDHCGRKTDRIAIPVDSHAMRCERTQADGRRCPGTLQWREDHDAD